MLPRFAGHSVTAKLFQERGETVRDRLIDGIVPGPEPLPDFPQPWPLGVLPENQIRAYR
jgi:hypothetical protein